MKNLVRFRWWKLSLLIVVLIVVVGAIYLNPYKPDVTAQADMQGKEGVAVTQHSQWIQFEPDKLSGPTVIFYPGGLVKPESYAPLGTELARKGHRTYIVKMPVNLAVLDGERALPIIEASTGETFVIGGHSLGGVMASRFAAAHQDLIKGVFFLASYPDPKGSLTSPEVPALSIVGTNDQVVQRDKLEDAKQYLPPSTVYKAIEGGNHAQFGSYGFQKGDGVAAIPAEEQLQITLSALEDWMTKL